MLASSAVAVVCLALIALIWINTVRAVHEESVETRVRAETVVTADATILVDQVRRELNEVEQSLTILQSSWNTNPRAFNLTRWHAVLPVLTDVAQDIFIANEKHIIVQDVMPQAVGQGIGSAYANFANGSLEPISQGGTADDAKTAMLEGELGPSGVQRQYVLYLIRPLASPPGWLIGASYNTGALAKLFASASLGMHGVAALVDTHRGRRAGRGRHCRIAAAAEPCRHADVPGDDAAAGRRHLDRPHRRSMGWIGFWRSGACPDAT